jgi:hypothetical protein
MKNRKINYFPIYEIATFGIIFSSLTVALFVSELNTWIILFLMVVSYFTTLGTSKIIRLNNDSLRIISLNPFFRSHPIKTNLIVKITSSQSSTYDTVITAEMYFIFKKKYDLEYIDEKGKKQEVTFSIYNQKKEKMLFEALNASYGA